MTGSSPSRTGGIEAARILIVDDEESNVLLLESILKVAGFANLVSTTDPRRALALIDAHTDLVLLDLKMPFMDGYAILEQLRQRTQKEDYLPVLVLTADTQGKAKRKALSLGARDFLSKPFDEVEVLLRIRSLLDTRSLHSSLASQKTTLEQRVRDRTANLSVAMQRLRDLEVAARETAEETIRHLAVAAELRDEETGRHIERMSRYSALLGARIGIDPGRCETLRLAASMHDIGKIGIPDSILRKTGPLEPGEMDVMRGHAEIGHRILADSHADVLRLAGTIALSHHERFDGAGYPRGLAGSQIPPEGRIAAVADVFDALTSDRVYRRRLAIDEAVEAMRAERGLHFDPVFLDLFLDSMHEVLGIHERFSDERISPRPSLLHAAKTRPLVGRAPRG